MTNGAWSKIAIVGAGAIGSYFGAVLAQAGNDVTLIGRQSHVDAINRDGLRLQDQSAERRVEVSATTDIAAVSGAGLVLFCVKSLDTEEAARQIAPHLARDAVILSLQNGVDNVERIRLHVRNRVIPALVYIGANVPVPGRVKHSGGDQIVIGQLGETGTSNEPDLLEQIAALFAAADISVRISSSIEVDLWTKLVMNAAYNVICALSGAPYGKMVELPEI
jgi:2-dehydropantoate 2-reductase